MPPTMRAATLFGPQSARIVEVIVPTPGPGEVLIKLEGCGICGSNLPVWQGRAWFDYPFQAGAPGHEGWGRVAAVGSQVANIREGDRVAAITYRAFADYDLAAASNVVPLPTTLANRDVPGEALACIMNIYKRTKIRSGDLVGVVGVGFMGAVLVQLAHAAGAEVIAVSRRAEALQVACGLGARHAFVIDDRPTDDLGRHIRTSIREDGFDVVIEATGLQHPLDLAATLCRIGGRLVIAGFHQDGGRTVNMCDWNWRALDVINAHTRDENIYAASLHEAVTALTDGRLNPDPLYTHRIPLDRIADAFRFLEERPAGFMKSNVFMGDTV